MEVKKVVVRAKQLRSNRMTMSNAEYGIELEAELKKGDDFKEVVEKLKKDADDMIERWFLAKKLTE